MPMRRDAAGARRMSRASAFVFAALLTLAGCATNTADLRMTPGVVTALAPGQQASLPGGVRLAYVRLRSDSRCPVGVTCIQAGWADIDVVLDVDGARHPRVLSTRSEAAATEAAGWRVELVELGRGPSPLARMRASTAPR